MITRNVRSLCRIRITHQQQIRQIERQIEREREVRGRERERHTDIQSEIVAIVLGLRDIASHHETTNCIRDIAMHSARSASQILDSQDLLHNTMRRQNAFDPDADPLQAATGNQRYAVFLLSMPHRCNARFDAISNYRTHKNQYTMNVAPKCDTPSKDIIITLHELQKNTVPK